MIEPVQRFFHLRNGEGCLPTRQTAVEFLQLLDAKLKNLIDLATIDPVLLNRPILKLDVDERARIGGHRVHPFPRFFWLAVAARRSCRFITASPVSTAWATRGETSTTGSPRAIAAEMST